MSPAEQQLNPHVADDFNMQIALPETIDFVQLPYSTITGKLSRFLARNVVTKKLTMRNARPLVSFTFDDAAASACSAGVILLEQHQARGTYYISGGKSGALSPTGRLAGADEIKAVHARGHEIGCHTYSHSPVGAISQGALDADLERNHRFLKGIHGEIAVRNFAYPYGYMSFMRKHHLGKRFDSCRSLTFGVNAGDVDLGALKSCALESVSIDRQTISKLIAETVRRNGWLLFASHDVADEPSKYGVQPELLTFALRSAREAGCDLVTVSRALQLIAGETDGKQAP